MTPPLRLLLIADVGGEEMRHLGDEAMLEANLDALRRLIPGVAFTVVSHDPAWTAARYGVDAVAPLGFTPDPSAGAERDSLLDRILTDATAAGPRTPTIDALARADGLVISGGGNLSSTWPDLLYERAALLHLARIFSKPAVVLGQTIGPRLGGRERLLLAAVLPSARFVGLRELPSAALALELGVPPERLWYQCDDALVSERRPVSVPLAGGSGALSIAVTIDPQIRAAGEAVFGALVTQLRELSDTTGASLLLIPHAFGGEFSDVPSDLSEAFFIADRVGLPHTVIAPGLDAGEAMQAAADAAMVISSRYHPIVFGLAAGTPCIGIYGDEYCRIKLQGALAHARLERWTLSYDDVVRGELLTRARALWQAKDRVRHELDAYHQAWCEQARERWTVVLHALDAEKTITPAAATTMFGRPMQDLAPSLASALEARRQEWERERESFEKLSARCDHAESYARWLKNELGPTRTIRRYAGAVIRWIRG